MDLHIVPEGTLTKTTFKKIADNLYELDYRDDYSMAYLLTHGAKNMCEIASLISKANDFPKSTKVKCEINTFEASRTTYFNGQDDAKIYKVGYGISIDSPMIIVRTCAIWGHRSVALVPASFVLSKEDIKNIDNITDMTKFMLAPHACIAGVNESGVTVTCKMTNRKGMHQKNGRVQLPITSIIRQILDWCPNTDDALRTLSRHEAFDLSKESLSLTICDAKGDHAKVEYIDGIMNITRESKWEDNGNCDNVAIIKKCQCQDLSEQSDAQVLAILSNYSYSFICDTSRKEVQLKHKDESVCIGTDHQRNHFECRKLLYP